MVNDPQILFVDHTTEPGGAELALRRLLDRTPDEVSAVVLTPLGTAGIFSRPTKFRHSMIGPRQLPGAATGRGPLRKARYFVDILRQAVAIRRSPDFRHAAIVVSNTSRSSVYLRLASLGTGKVRAAYLRDEVSAESLGLVGYWLVSRSIRSASLVIANSSHTLSKASPHIDSRARTLVIASPLGMSPRPIGERSVGSVDTIGMVARIDSWKGHALLIRAFALAFPDSHIQLHLAGGPLFGGETLLRELHQVATDTGIGERVVFHGHVEDVVGFIDRMDICVQSSIRPEPLGQNVLQYLVRRCPVVVSNTGGPAEWVFDGINGLLFDEGSEQSLAQALVRLSDDLPLRTRIATQEEVMVPADTEIANHFFGFLTDRVIEDQLR